MFRTRHSLLRLIAFACALICCANAFAGDAFSTLEQTLRAEKPVEEKLAAISRYQSRLDETQARSLLALAPKIEIELIYPLTRLVKARGFPSPVLDSLLGLMKSAGDDAPRAADALDSAYVLFKDDPNWEQPLAKIATAYLQSVAALAGKPEVKTLLTARRVDDLVELNRTLFKQTCLKLLEDTDVDLQQSALNLVSSQDCWFLLRDKDLPILARLAASKEDEIAKAASELLEQITHQRPADSNWTAWFAANNGKFHVLDNALQLAANKTADPADRQAAFEQLGFAESSEQLKNNISVLSRIAGDATEKPDSRVAAIAVLQDSLWFRCRTEPDEMARNQLLDVLLPLAADADDNIKIAALNFGLSGVAARPEVSARLHALLNDWNKSPLVRAAAARELSTLKRPEVATAALLLLKEEVPKLQNAERPTKVAIEALKNMTGKDHGRNIGGWEDAIAEMKGIPRARPVSPKTPEKIRTDDLPAAKGDLISTSIESMEVSKEARFNAGVNVGSSQRLRVTLALTWNRDAQLVTYGGYLVQEAVTDSGESMTIDWQRGIIPARPVYSHGAWISSKPVADKQEDRYAVDLGRCDSVINGLSRLKGYFIIKRATKELKTIELQNVPASAGNFVDHPDLKSTRLRITEIQGTTLKLEHINDAAHYYFLAGLVFTSENGEVLKCRLARLPEFDKEVIRYTLSLDAPLTAGSKATISLFDGIVEERVPFEFSDLKF